MTLEVSVLLISKGNAILTQIAGLFIRPPYQGEEYANWERSTAGLKEDDDGWVYVPPVPGVFTAFPG